MEEHFSEFIFRLGATNSVDLARKTLRGEIKESEEVMARLAPYTFEVAATMELVDAVTKLENLLKLLYSGVNG